MSTVTNLTDTAVEHLPAVPLTLEGASVLHQMLRVRWTAWKQLPAEQRADIALEASKMLAEMERKRVARARSFRCWATRAI